MASTASATYGIADSTGGANLAGKVALSYTGESVAGQLTLTGATTYTIDLAMMPAAGLRFLLVSLGTLDGSGAAVSAPVTIHATSNSLAWSLELSPGGVFQFANPAPVHSITALQIISTANAVVYVAGLG